MKTLEQLKTEYAAILEGAKTQNRSMTKTETDSLDGLKTEIAALEATNTAAAVAAAQEQRSAAAARVAGNAGSTLTMPKADYLRDLGRIALKKPAHNRAFTEGGQDVGNKEVIADVVRVFEQQSPILKNFNNLQQRSTGNSFSFTKIVQGTGTNTGAGYVKTEGQTGRSDTVSSVIMDTAIFKTYSGETILVSQEMLEDAVADISKEVISFGMAKGTLAFDFDAVAALQSAFGTTPTYVATAGTTWALSDLSNAFYSIPNRNRYGVKYTMNPADAAAIVSQLTTWNQAFTSIIGLDATSIVVDHNQTAGVVIVGNLDLALAIGMKSPVRVWTQEVSAGVNYETQPRFAVALRDGTALAARQLKAA